MAVHVPPRIFRRVPFEAAVRLKFDRFRGFVEEYSANLSLGGMFIRTDESVPVGTELSIEFRLGEDYELITGRGRVVWVRTLDQAVPDHPAGLGIRFLELTPGSRELIFRMVERRVREGGDPFDLEEAADGLPDRPPEPGPGPEVSFVPAEVGEGDTASTPFSSLLNTEPPGDLDPLPEPPGRPADLPDEEHGRGGGAAQGQLPLPGGEAAGAGATAGAASAAAAEAVSAADLDELEAAVRSRRLRDMPSAQRAAQGESWGGESWGGESWSDRSGDGEARNVPPGEGRSAKGGSPEEASEDRGSSRGNAALGAGLPGWQQEATPGSGNFEGGPSGSGPSRSDTAGGGAARGFAFAGTEAARDEGDGRGAGALGGAASGRGDVPSAEVAIGRPTWASAPEASGESPGFGPPTQREDLSAAFATEEAGGEASARGNGGGAESATEEAEATRSWAGEPAPPSRRVSPFGTPDTGGTPEAAGTAEEGPVVSGAPASSSDSGASAGASSDDSFSDAPFAGASFSDGDDPRVSPFGTPEAAADSEARPPAGSPLGPFGSQGPSSSPSGWGGEVSGSRAWEGFGSSPSTAAAEPEPGESTWSGSYAGAGVSREEGASSRNRGRWILAAVLLLALAVAGGWWFGLLPFVGSGNGAGLENSRNEVAEAGADRAERSGASDVTAPGGSPSAAERGAGAGAAGTGATGSSATEGAAAPESGAAVPDGAADAAPRDVASGSRGTPSAGSPDPAGAASPSARVPSPPGAVGRARAGRAEAPPAGDGSRATRIEDLSFVTEDGATLLLVRADQPIQASDVVDFRLDGGDPRHVVRILGIEEPFGSGRIAVGTDEVRQVRSGLHGEGAGRELHLVLDLASPGARVRRIETLGDRLRIEVAGGSAGGAS